LITGHIMLSFLNLFEIKVFSLLCSYGIGIEYQLFYVCYMYQVWRINFELKNFMGSLQINYKISDIIVFKSTFPQDPFPSFK